MYNKVNDGNNILLGRLLQFSSTIGTFIIDSIDQNRFSNRVRILNVFYKIKTLVSHYN